MAAASASPRDAAARRRGALHPIRICIVDDQTLFVRGIRLLLGLAEDIEVVGEAADGEEALPLLEPALPRPTSCCSTSACPSWTGLGVLEALSEKPSAPPLPRLVLTTFDDDELVLRAIRPEARAAFSSRT